MERSAIPPPKQCGSYRPGHSVHWIQALHVANRPEVEARTRWGALHGIDEGVIQVHFDGGEVERFRNHETDRLSTVAEGGSGVVSVNDQYSLLRAGDGFCFSIARDTGQPLSSCPGEEPLGTDPDALVKRLHSHGGF
jgi:hypothetical protein